MEERESIEKILCLITLLFVVAILTGCAALSATKTTLIKTNLTILKGTWSGTRDFMTSDSTRTQLEIDNNTEPMQGEWMIENVRFGTAVIVGASPGSTVTIDFKNGHISDQRTFLIIEGNNFVELTLYNGGKKPMDRLRINVEELG